MAKRHFPHYPAQNMLVFRKQQICWDSPERTIHCLLTKVSRQREADARVIESLAMGLNALPLTTWEQE